MIDTILSDFVHKNKNELLRYITADDLIKILTFRLHGHGWKVLVLKDDELLGEYLDGKLTKGYWFDEENKGIDFHKLYEKLKKQSLESNMKFASWLEQQYIDKNTMPNLTMMDYTYLILLDDQNGIGYNSVLMHVCDACGFKALDEDDVSEHITTKHRKKAQQTFQKVEDK